MSYLVYVCMAIFVAVQILGTLLFLVWEIAFTDERWSKPLAAGRLAHNVALTMSLYVLLIGMLEGATQVSASEALGLALALYLTLAIVGIVDTAFQSEKLLPAIVGHIDIPGRPVRKLIDRMRANGAQAIVS